MIYMVIAKLFDQPAIMARAFQHWQQKIWKKNKSIPLSNRNINYSTIGQYINVMNHNIIEIFSRSVEELTKSFQ